MEGGTLRIINARIVGDFSEVDFTLYMDGNNLKFSGQTGTYLASKPYSIQVLEGRV
jgi:hypothetical protein